MFKNKRVLISGGAGVIGKELIKLLTEKGAKIRVVDLVEKPKELAEIEYFQMDLSSNPQFLFRFDPDYVFHLAADFERSEESYEFWESNLKNNVMASHNFLKQISVKKSVKKVIFTSSYLIYDKKAYNLGENECLLQETSIINPRNLTGISKLQTECDLEFMSKNECNKFEQASARIFRVYGKGSRDIISRWVRDILRGYEITVFDADNSFDYIFSRDVARGLIKLCENKVEGIFNLGFGKSYEINDVLQILKEELGDFKIKTTNDSIFKERSRANISKLKKALNWQPSISLVQGIREIIEYEKSKINK